MRHGFVSDQESVIASWLNFDSDIFNSSSLQPHIKPVYIISPSVFRPSCKSYIISDRVLNLELWWREWWCDEVRRWWCRCMIAGGATPVRPQWQLWSVYSQSTHSYWPALNNRQSELSAGEWSEVFGGGGDQRRWESTWDQHRVGGHKLTLSSDKHGDIDPRWLTMRSFMLLTDCM